jgi:glyoxylate/hydroxypyruvate reductase
MWVVAGTWSKLTSSPRSTTGSSGAMIDVLREEPPRADHPFWGHPRILLTPHVASMTQPATAVPVLLDNIRRYERGEPLLNVVDRARGY